MVIFSLNFVIGITGIALLTINEEDVASKLKTNVVLNDIQQIGITTWIDGLMLEKEIGFEPGIYTICGKLQVNYEQIQYTYYDITVIPPNTGKDNGK